MKWQEIKASIQADLLSRGLANPNIRLNALKRLEKMLERCYRGFPDDLSEVVSDGRKAVASKFSPLKKSGQLTSSEQSVLKMIFDRLEGLPTPTSRLNQAEHEASSSGQSEGTPRLTIEDLSVLRRKLIRQLESLEAGVRGSDGQGIGAQIGRLTRSGHIPRDIAACMRVVTEARNRAEYEAQNPSPALGNAVLAAWKAIEEWERSR